MSSSLPSLRTIAVELLISKTEIEMPEFPTNYSEEAADYIVKKVIWWILKNYQDPVQPNEVIHPELHDEEEDGINSSVVTPISSYDELDLPHVREDSDTEDKKSTDHHEESPPQVIAKKSKPSKPYIEEEVVGAGILGAKIRQTSANNTINLSESMESETTKEDTGDFINVFECTPETDYKAGIVSGTCTVCKAQVDGKQQLKDHLNSASHKKCFRDLSLDIGNLQYLESVGVNGWRFAQNPIVIQATVKVYDPKEPLTVPIPPSANKWRISPEEKAAFLRSINIGDYDIPFDNPQNDAKLKLRYANKWTNVLEKKWKTMKEQEKKLIDEYKKLRSDSLADPSSHPARAKEWLKFWEEWSSKLIKKGKDPDSHSYHAEWCSYWLKRMLQLLKADVELKISRLKTSAGLDASSLNHLFDNPVNNGVRRPMPGARSYNNSRNTYQNASNSRRTNSNKSYHNSSSSQRRGARGGDEMYNYYVNPSMPSSSSSYNNFHQSPYPSPDQYRYAYNDQFSPQQTYHNSFNNYNVYNSMNPNENDYYGHYY